MPTEPNLAPSNRSGSAVSGRSAIVIACAAAAWLLVLTVSNLSTQGAFRATVLFAVPVCAVAWHDWQAGFVFAAIAVVCAWVGGALPEPGNTEPVWMDALISFAKLSVDAIVAFTWGRRLRTRASAENSQSRGPGT